MLTSEDIRRLRDKFWQSKSHKWLPPDKLVPTQGDTTAMFTLAWMQQLVPYLMWKPHPLGKRLYNIQKCVRTNDIEEVWDERHLTFFEMMWNWSLGDYFKKDAINWSVEFLTKYLGIPLNKIGATVFKWEWDIPKDEESKQIWKEVWIEGDRIKELGKDDNFRWPAWEIWPCWPCTEIYFDRGDLRWPADWNLWENDRYLEIRNNVFMEYYKDKSWNYTRLKQQNVDTWMGLERITMVLQEVPTVFETDLFIPILRVVEKFVKKTYPLKDLSYDNIKNLSKNKIISILDSVKDSIDLKRFRVIADHIRSSIFLIADGVIPSNEWRGYVLRRLIRRLYYNLILLNPGLNLEDVEKFVDEVVEVIAKKYWPWRQEVKDEKENVKKILFSEITKFDKTIRRGLKLLEDILNTIGESKISWEIVFKLYDTYGFPVELIKEIVESKWLEVDVEGFKNFMKQAQEKSRQATKDIFKRGIDWGKYLEWIPQTEFVWYDQLELDNPKLLKDFAVEIDWKPQRVLVFDKTPFYAESWWQTGDRWVIILDNGETLKVKDVKKYAGVFLHFVE